MSLRVVVRVWFGCDFSMCSRARTRKHRLCVPNVKGRREERERIRKGGVHMGSHHRMECKSTAFVHDYFRSAILTNSSSTCAPPSPSTSSSIHRVNSSNFCGGIRRRSMKGVVGTSKSCVTRNKPPHRHMRVQCLPLNGRHSQAEMTGRE